MWIVLWRWMVDGVLYVDGMLEMDDGYCVVCGWYVGDG